MVTLGVDTVTFEVSPLARLTVRFEAAGAPSVTANAADWPGATVTLAGRLMVPKLFTVTLAVASVRLAALAWITVDPAATPVTGTETLSVFCAIVTLAGTVATLELLELRLTATPPAGANAESFSVRFGTSPTPRVNALGSKLRTPITFTVWLSPVKPTAEAVTVADPRATPATCAAVFGVVACSGMVTVWVTVSLDESLLASVIVTPPTGAGVVRLTCSGVDWPRPTLTLLCTEIRPRSVTLTFAEPLLYPAELPVMLAAPAASPVTVNKPPVLPAGIVTVAGCTSTIPLLLADRLTTVPVLGAAALRATVPLIVRPIPSVPVASVTVMLGTATFTVARPGRKPGTEALIVVLPMACGVTVTFTPVAFSGTVALSGTLATPGSRLARLTGWPPAPAGPVSVTVSVPGSRYRFNGLGVSVTAMASPVIVTVTGELFVNPSFTMS